MRAETLILVAGLHQVPWLHKEAAKPLTDPNATWFGLGNPFSGPISMEAPGGIWNRGASDYDSPENLGRRQDASKAWRFRVGAQSAANRAANAGETADQARTAAQQYGETQVAANQGSVWGENAVPHAEAIKRGEAELQNNPATAQGAGSAATQLTDKTVDRLAAEDSPWGSKVTTTNAARNAANQKFDTEYKGKISKLPQDVAAEVSKKRMDAVKTYGPWVLGGAGLISGLMAMFMNRQAPPAQPQQPQQIVVQAPQQNPNQVDNSWAQSQNWGNYNGGQGNNAAGYLGQPYA